MIKKEHTRILQDEVIEGSKEPKPSAPAWPFNMSAKDRAAMRALVHNAERSAVDRAPAALRALQEEDEANDFVDDDRSKGSTSGQDGPCL